MSAHLYSVASALLLIAMISTLPSAALADDGECLECHALGADVVDLPSQEIDTETWLASIHAEMDFSCTDCHSEVEDYPHESIEPVRCSDCHEDAAIAFSAGSHASVEDFGEEGCGICHGIHDVKAAADPLSRVSLDNQPTTCFQCHGDIEIVGEAGLDTHNIERYRGSVHGLVAQQHDGRKPAVCADCHGGHEVHCACEEVSTTSPFRLVETCGQCHPQVAKSYAEGVHWHAVERGRTAAPTCIVCHGIHSIKNVPDADASHTESRLVRSTCVGCHSSEALMTEFGVAPARVSSYEASYHGLVSQRGRSAVADCASCHGVHAILPSSNPKSKVHPDRLQETCGSCHPGAGVEFATMPVHYVGLNGSGADFGTKVTEWVRIIYWVLILGVIGGMLLHNLVIVSWYLRRNWKRDKGERMRRRFDDAQIVQHGALVVSFFVLVFSGFMLAYPQSWWSVILVDLGVNEEVRRWTHRVAAIVMTIASFIHLFWILGTPYGRAELKRIAPGMRDVREVMQNMRFHLGKTDRPAAFAKYDYPAKAEYWALVWGTIVMLLSGLILWFPVIATSFLPHWSIKVAEVIHLFEAWLATLAILVFHFFYVFGHPEVYPLNFAMFHGGMRREVAEHHHPSWADDEEKGGGA